MKPGMRLLKRIWRRNAEKRRQMLEALEMEAYSHMEQESRAYTYNEIFAMLYWDTEGKTYG